MSSGVRLMKETMMEAETKIRRRLRRIEAMRRWSRMNGFGGLIPGSLEIEARALSAVLV